MHLSEPRIPPVDPATCDPDTRRLLAESFGQQGPNVLNIFATLANHPKLLKRWSVLGNHLLAKSSLAPRDREIVILRAGWRAHSDYEWAQHVRIGREAGLTDTEIGRIAAGPDVPGWSAADATLLRAVDELYDAQFLSEPTWMALSAALDTHQVMDLVFTAGMYIALAMALNSFGVQVEPQTAATAGALYPPPA